MRFVNEMTHAKLFEPQNPNVKILWVETGHRSRNIHAIVWLTPNLVNTHVGRPDEYVIKIRNCSVIWCSALGSHVPILNEITTYYTARAAEDFVTKQNKTHRNKVRCKQHFSKKRSEKQEMKPGALNFWCLETIAIEAESHRDGSILMTESQRF